MAQEYIFHICRRDEWTQARAQGVYGGSSQDREDGFIHFSTASQVQQSAAKHRAGQRGLVLLTVDPGALGDALRWELSRDNRLFPHLYGALAPSAVMRTDDLPLDENSGQHVFPTSFSAPHV
ncbi:DUF952 domain-containing protein [Varunaivibrio sulfuroxidans]|uniref:DUF952 domain-containing protein n=1 Tax=Varunaivibrio sulfuroxidans TaxID=1773489 RepID=UPI0010433DD0|nr:DUF952 domain-containing protein [Varunaivibrio sulfuroxidans]WES30862.1 DUF952 domain-containing protein [Varunaivibrio sulfuroxidans]